MRRFASLLAMCLAAACSRPRAPEATALPTTAVTLPNGKVIRAELAIQPADKERGLMFRTSLEPDGGMLFVFEAPLPRRFWMFQTLIPLDILWLDAGHAIVHISANTPPCREQQAARCPGYEGERWAQYVLELAAGAAAANGLKLGDKLQF